MTPMHFQYLVGICCLRCQPDAVEMTIGDRVRDAVSESDRDVDVTIMVAETDGTRTAFMGYEAKMEKGALDVAEVEQLVTKLNDMPDLTIRAIVSAKGFSETAIRKASKRGVKLFEFRDWTENVQAGFPKMSLQGPASESLYCCHTEFRWVGENTPVFLNPSDPARDQYLAQMSDEMPLLQADGSPHPKYANLKAFFVTFTAEVAGRLSERPEAQAVIMAPLPYPPNERPDGPVGEPIYFPDVFCDIEEPIYFRTQTGLQRMKSAHFSPRLQWHYKRIRSEYRILVDVHTQDVYAGAAITSTPIHEEMLMAFVLIPGSTDLLARTVLLTEKQKNFIHRLKVRA